MPTNPPKDMPRITPYLYYEDVGAALDWLVAAFGFHERMRLTMPDGTVNHGEMALSEDGVVMLGRPGDSYENPAKTEQRHAMVYVYVDEVDKHYEQAKAAGAKILEEPTDQFYGDRRYTAEDLEGQQWAFAERVRDVPPEELVPPA